MSDLPSGWEWATVDQIAARERNALAIGPFGSNLKVSDYRPSGVPVIFVRNIRAHAFELADLRFVSPEKADSLRAHQVRCRDLLITKMGDPPGDAAIYPRTEPGIITADCIKLTAHHSVDVRYLLYSFSSPQVRRQVGNITQGVAQRKVSLERFRKGISLPIAPLAEQKRIVVAIEEQFSRLDAGTSALRRAWRNLRRMRDSIYTAAVTGRLTTASVISSTVDASRDAPLSLSLAGENARKIKRANEDLLHQIWNVPSSWTWKLASEVCEVIASGSTPAKSAMTPGQGEVPYLKVYNLTQTGSLDFSVRPTFIDRATHETTLRRSILLPGDILINIVGPPLGKVSVVPNDYPEWNTNQAVVTFRPVRSVHQGLLKYWLLSPPVIGILKSTAKATAGQYNISLTTCRALPLPMPPREDQDLIVAAIEEKLSMIDNQEAAIMSSMSHAASLRSAILSAAFSGNLL